MGAATWQTKTGMIQLRALLIAILLCVFSIAQSPLRAQNPQIDSLKQLLKETADDSSFIGLQLELGKRYLNHNTDSTLQCINQAQEKALSIDNPTPGITDMLGSSYMIQGVVYGSFLDNYDTALVMMQQARKEFERSGNQEKLAFCYGNTGIIQEHMGRLTEALESYQEVALIFRAAENYPHLATAYNNMGNAYRKMGNYPKAMQILQEGLVMAEEHELKEAGIPLYQNLSLVHDLSGNMEASNSTLRTALQLAKEVGDEYAQIHIRSDIGENLYMMGDLGGALAVFEDNLRLLEQHPHHLFSMNTNFNTGNVLIELERFEAARTHLNLVLELALSSNNMDFQSKTNALLGKLEVLLGNYRKAADYSEQAVAQLPQVPAANDKAGILKQVAENLEKAGAFEKALRYYRQSNALADSLLTVERQKTIADLDARYQTSEKERELERKDLLLKEEQAKAKAQDARQMGLIAVLGLLALLVVMLLINFLNKQRINRKLLAKNQQITKQKEEITRQSEMLEEINAGKDRLFSIISHDLRGPLSTVQQLLELAEEGTITQEEFKQQVKQMAGTFNYTNDLLNNLLSWARNQLEGLVANREQVNLTTLVQDNKRLIENRLKKKSLQLDINLPEGQHVYADRNMLDTVLRNLLSNAVKFSPEGSLIVVNSEVKGKTVEVSILDKGEGLAIHKVNLILEGRYFTTVGTSQEKGTGLGLQICKDFIEKNGGQLQVESQLGKGSRFYFSLPISG